MYFKRIELNGFKSFADPVSIEFTDGITCIVGPNGAGKSNISDAIRWVLGEQSPKTLRGGKMEEVIFAGTQSRKAKGMAEVTLVIDNSKRSLPIDFAEVGITRRMYRSGESEYLINRTPCRLRDIRELIMDTGIGVEGYSVIGQGRISDIIDNKMDSRREIFEEAAGVTKYRTRKAEAEKKLETASGNLDRVNDIVGEIESRIDGLRADSEKASEYLDIKEKYRDVEVNIILRNIEAAEEKSEAVRSELSELGAAVLEAEEKRDVISAELDAQRALAGRLESELEDGRASLALLAEEMHAASAEFELGNERMAALERDRQRLSGELSELDEKLAAEEESCERLGIAGKEAEEQLSASAKRLEETEEAFRLAIDRENAAVEHSEELKDSIFDIASRISASEAEIAGTESLRAALKLRRDKLLEEESGKESGNAKLADSHRELSARKEELSALLSSSSDSMGEAGRSERAARIAEADAAARIEELKISESRLSARAKMIDELESAYEGYGGGVRFLMKEKPSGLIGTVGELISVPRGWETAIEAELGAKLQNIVCRRDSDARDAIELLKKNRAGRLTFLPLGSLRPAVPPDHSSLKGARGFLGAAWQNVSCAEGCEAVVKYLLGRVMVVDCIDNAIAMAGKNAGAFRFVTLEGEIISPAGAISGGSLKSNAGNILSRKSERTEIEEQLAEIVREIKDSEKAKEGAAKAAADAKARMAAVSEENRNAEMELALTSNELIRVEAMQRENRQISDRRSLELAELEKELAGSDKIVAEAEKRIEELKAEKKRAEEQSLKVAEELAEARVFYEDSRTAETEARLAEASAQERLRSASENAARAARGLRELKAARKSKGAEFAEVEKAIAGISGAGGKAQTLIQELSEKKAVLEKELAESESARKEAYAAAASAEKERIEAERQLYERQLKKYDADARVSRFESQTEGLKEKLWDEFELSYAQAAEKETPDFVMSRAVKQSREYRERLRSLGDVNIGAIEEYKAVSERYEFLTMQRDDTLQAMEELRRVIADMDVTIRRQYKESFDRVVENFENIFSELFGGGHARLSMEDPDNPLESGVEIEAQPPGKKLQNMNLLSGGEKTMTAIALMFAVLKAKPTPFCILDEVEAALDDINIDRFANYLKKFEQTQFVLVTHQKATMEHAAALYGVTMPEHGVSRMLSLKLGSEPEI
ncbi:MAG TPA: chromosome segregation protein SMC [Bacillota bacterium]|nr:chromosome segregation protein SMC [Bacillota bacterium]